MLAELIMAFIFVHLIEIKLRVGIIRPILILGALRGTQQQ